MTEQTPRASCHTPSRSGQASHPYVALDAHGSDGAEVQHLAASVNFTPPTRDAELRKAWQRRSWQHKASHRWNVISAFVRRDINHHSLILGLLEPHAVEHLALRPQHRLRGMLVVCPAAARELDRMCGPSEPRGPIV